VVFLHKNLRFFPLVLGILTFFARYPAQGGEDIGNARKNMQSQSPTDFWGGVSSIIYGHFPSFGFLNWETSLIASQIAIAALSLSVLMRGSGSRTSKKLLWHVFLTYISLLFCSQGTRDGLQFTLLLAGFTFGIQPILIKKPIIRKSICLTLIAAGISLRPWLGLALVPLMKLALIGFLVVIIPIVFEFGATKAQNLKASYPQQQVMIMDTAATYCWGINASSADRALEALKLFTSDPNIGETICQFFRADTWLSLTKSSLPSNANLDTDFWIIEAGDGEKYQKLQSVWIENIFKDPVTYLQNKTFFFTKLVIASEMRNIHLLNSNSWFGFLQNLYIAIYDVVLATHLMSLLGLWVGVYVFSQIKKNQRQSKVAGLSSLMAFSILWGTLSSIAYIGSNGRYTYTATLLTLILMTFNDHSKKEFNQ
jgi:hypothetical protein